MQRITTFLPAGTPSDPPVTRVELPHDLRHLRRKVLPLDNGDMVMLDLKEPVLFACGDLLVLEDGGLVEIVAAKEKLFEIKARDGLHLLELAWHLFTWGEQAEIIEPDILKSLMLDELDRVRRWHTAAVHVSAS